ncbi:MAG: 4Fe-4S cluster-binding domain-containing protein [Clostridia bacterium]|nr:4Fe-4S cluster-binding domain-containing protein [Clostridia bacterium]
MMKVVEIFDSIDGEGIRTGKTATFIRLAGCNLRCSYCDTLYALFGEEESCEYTEMSIDEIIEKVNKSYKRVTLTGGEPLLHLESAELVKRLLNEGCQVNIETNGAVDINEFSAKIPDTSNMFYTIDYKLPSSGMNDRMIWSNFENLRPSDVVKFVVGSGEDVNMMKAVMDRLTEKYEVMPHIYAGVVFGEYDMQTLIENIMREPVLKDVVFQLQIHKIIWNPDERGV